MTVHIWRAVSRPPASLEQARLSLHWAAQLLAAAADAICEHARDDSHTTLHWQQDIKGLVGNRLAREIRVGLKFAPMTLLVLDRGNVASALQLSGRKLDDARVWLGEQLSRNLNRKMDVQLRDYEMPAHTVASGAPFDEGMTESLVELGHYFANADIVLKELADADPRTNPIVEAWPHHFDMGGIFVLDTCDASNKAPRIGFGFSPGDQMISEPYYYVTPWPLAEDASFPELASGGFWHRDGYTGGVLVASRIVSFADDEQHEQVAAFLRSAVKACQSMIAMPEGRSEATHPTMQ